MQTIKHVFSIFLIYRSALAKTNMWCSVEKWSMMTSLKTYFMKFNVIFQYATNDIK